MTMKRFKEMSMKKKTVLFGMLAVAMFVITIPLFAVTARAATVVASGYCGSTYANFATWTYTDDGTLTIEGTGAIQETSTDNQPWKAYKDSIKKVVIGQGITTIGQKNFSNCKNLSEVILPEGLNMILRMAFAYCEKLKTITLPSTMTNISSQAFITNSSGLETVYYNGTTEDWTNLKNGQRDYSDAGINNAKVICMLTYHPAAASTCGQRGNIEYYSNSVDGKNYNMYKTTVLSDVLAASVPHTFESTYKWAADYSSCTVSAKCSVCGAVVPDLTDRDITKKNVAATCTDDSYTEYTAFKNPGSSLYITTQTKRVTNSGTAPGHSESRNDAWSNDYSTCTRTLSCSRCGLTIATQTVNTTKSGTAPTCTVGGVFDYFATFTDPLLIKNVANANTRVYPAALGHKPMAPRYDLNTAKTEMTAEIWCANFGEVIEKETVTATAKVITPKTCTVDGVTTYTANFTKSSFESPKVLTITTYATGHTYVDGVCTTCGDAKPNYLTANADGYYEIDNVVKLKWFAAYVNAGNTSANALLKADLSLDNTFTRIGTSACPYAGTFDGGRHTITVNYSDVNYNFVGGLFDYVGSTTIKNLTVTGSISTARAFAGGVVSLANNRSSNVNFENVFSSVNITSSYAGDNTNGGIAACIDGKTIMTNCGYTGTITSNGYNCGGLLGYSYSSAEFVNCCMAGTMVLSQNDGSAIFSRGRGVVTCTNSYYLNSYGTVQGTAKTAEQFASGEVTYLLNSGTTDGTQAWYQTTNVGTPAFSGNTVYYGYVNCGATEKTYANTKLFDTIPDHAYGKWINNADGTHTGTCSVCGATKTEDHVDADSNNSCDLCGASMVIVSVDVAWGAMDFTYTEGSKGTWNPETCVYENATSAGWSCAEDANKITVTSESSVDLTASFSYRQAEGVTVGGSFTDGKNPVTAALPLVKKGATAQPVTVYLNLSGAPAETAKDTVMGNVTVTIGGQNNEQ